MFVLFRTALILSIIYIVSPHAVRSAHRGSNVSDCTIEDASRHGRSRAASLSCGKEPLVMLDILSPGSQYVWTTQSS